MNYIIYPTVQESKSNATKLLSGHVFSWKHKVWAYVDHSKADTDRGSEPCITLYYILQVFFKELVSNKKDSCKVDTDDDDETLAGRGDSTDCSDGSDGSDTDTRQA